MAIAGFANVSVLGAGQMGSGIAQVCATAGLNVTVIDIKPEVLERARSGIYKSLEKLQGKNLLGGQEASRVLARITMDTNLKAAASTDLAIEAVIEDEKLKTELLKQLDGVLQPHALLATNTSSIPITRLAAATKRADKFIGMHFMNPVPLMKLVEVIPGMATAPATTDRILKLCEGLGKETSKSQDYPGFVVNRILMPMINEAFQALMEGVASAEDIDKGMKLGTNQPMGPLTLADFIGLDTCLAIMEVLHDGLGDSKYRPSPLLRKYVEAGFHGKKVGRGVYTYE